MMEELQRMANSFVGLTALIIGVATLIAQARNLKRSQPR
jgi:hypothetical protein